MLRERGQLGYLDLALRYGKTYRHWGMTVTCDPETVRGLLMDRANTDTRPKTYASSAKLPGASGILFMDGEKWRKRAHALAPVFQRNHAESFASSLHDIAHAHASRWSSVSRGEDLYDAIQQIGAESVLTVGYGLDPSDETVAQLGRALVNYKQRTMNPDERLRLDRYDTGLSRLAAIPWVVAGVNRMRRDTKAVRVALEAVLAQPNVDDGRTGWLTKLRDAGMSDQELVNEINHLYGAFNAIDFVATAALVEVARNPEWAKRLRAELSSVLGPDGVPQRDDLARLPQTNAFMLEVLRRYPVSLGVVRARQDESEVMISLFALHHHPDFWGSDSLEMKPERWLSSQAPAVPFSYVPFLEGPRKCLGRNMAEMHLLVMLAAIVRRFDLRVLTEPHIPPFLIPRYGAPIPFEIKSVR